MKFENFQDYLFQACTERDAEERIQDPIEQDWVGADKDWDGHTGNEPHDD